MKLLLLLLLLSLTGCSKELPEVPPAPTVEREAQTVEVPIRVIEEVGISVRSSPDWRGSKIQEGLPVTPQPGDTAGTWDPDRARDFPADEDCTPAQLLEKWLTVEGLTWEDLDARDCEQLILVVSDGKTGTSKQKLAHQHLGLGVLGTDVRHTSVPLCRGEFICHD